MMSCAKRGEPIVHKSKGIISITVCECLECGAKIYVEDVTNETRCPKCNGPLDPIGKTTRKIRQWRVSPIITEYKGISGGIRIDTPLKIYGSGRL